MNKEQIEKLWNMGSEILNRPIGSSKEFRTEDVRLIFDLALNSIPKAFDPEDETTWPAEDGEYLCFYKNGGIRTVPWYRTWFDSPRTPEEPWGHVGINHYMPIPEVET